MYELVRTIISNRGVKKLKLHCNTAAETFPNKTKIYTKIAPPAERRN